jgi:hypothetical protein
MWWLVMVVIVMEWRRKRKRTEGGVEYSILVN